MRQHGILEIPLFLSTYIHTYMYMYIYMNNLSLYSTLQLRKVDFSGGGANLRIGKYSVHIIHTYIHLMVCRVLYVYITRRCILPENKKLKNSPMQ